ncbi:uncharacterized protein LOC112553134 [Pomacea canaliculata]|nr:uncharacterized protein LOC112553134 [Pomacea canaliculata]
MSTMNAFVVTFEHSHLISTAAQARMGFNTPAPIKSVSGMKTVWTFGPSSVLSRNPVVLETWGMIAAIVWVYGALLLGLLMNILLIVSLTRHSRQRRTITTSDHGGEKDRQVRQTTRTVLTASLMFVFLSLPLVTNAVVTNLHPNYGYFSNNRYTFLFMQSLGGTCQCLSFCTDFISFLLLSSAYRSTLGSLIVRACSLFTSPVIHQSKRQSTSTQKHLQGQKSSVNKTETSNVTKETGED